MEYYVAVLFVCFFILRDGLSNEPVTFIFKRQFGWDPDTSNPNCNIDKSEAVSRTKNELIDANKRIDGIIREKITNYTTWVELSDLTSEHCDMDETIKFLSKKLVDDAQECLKTSLSEEEKSRIVKEFVSNSCASIYNKYNLQG